MKHVVALVAFFASSTLFATEFDSTKVRDLVNLVEVGDANSTASYFDNNRILKFSVNDCVSNTITSESEAPLELSEQIFDKIKESIGSDFYVTRTWTTEFEYWKDHPIVISVVLENASGQKIKVNFMATEDLKVRHVTMYSDLCGTF